VVEREVEQAVRGTLAHSSGAPQPAGQRLPLAFAGDHHLRDLQRERREVAEQRLRPVRQLARAAARRLALRGQVLREPRAERLPEEVEEVAVLGPVRPARLPVQDRRELVAASHLLHEGAELRRVVGREAAEGDRGEIGVGDVVAVLVERVGEHVPRARRREGLLVLGGCVQRWSGRSRT
jgi:hypothetical protein